MEIVTIEKRVFDEMMGKIDMLANLVDSMCDKLKEKKLSDWLDNNEVCKILNISLRSLQTLRDNGTLAYSQIGHKIYYLPKDIECILPIIDKKRNSINYKANKK